MFQYIREHWIPYLIGAVIAILLGLGGAYALGVKWSTPSDVREQHRAAEQQKIESVENSFEDTDEGGEAAEDDSSDSEPASEGDAASDSNSSGE